MEGCEDRPRGARTGRRGSRTGRERNARLGNKFGGKASKRRRFREWQGKEGARKGTRRKAKVGYEIGIIVKAKGVEDRAKKKKKGSGRK